MVITRGAAGALAWTPQTHVATPGRTTAVVDTVGAGDAFHAAVLTWLAEHAAHTPEAVGALAADAVESLLDFASLAAAIPCSRKGAQLPRRAELDLR